MKEDEKKFVNDIFESEYGFKVFTEELDRLREENKDETNDEIAENFAIELIEDVFKEDFDTRSKVNRFFEKHKPVIYRYESVYMDKPDLGGYTKKELIELTLKMIGKDYLNGKYENNNK